MKIFVINLPKDTERKASIEGQLNALGLEAEFIEAIYGKVLKKEEVEKLCPRFNDMGMSIGELGCSLSHLAVYEKIVSENIEAALILEDDATLKSDLIEVINFSHKIVKSRKPNVILLNKTNEYFDAFKKRIDSKYSLVHVIDSAVAIGYIINNSAAKKLINFLTPVKYKADEWKLLREKGVIKLYGVVPPIITPIDAPSTIGKRIYYLTEYDKCNQKRTLKETLKLALWRVFVRSWLKKIRP